MRDSHCAASPDDADVAVMYVNLARGRTDPHHLDQPVADDDDMLSEFEVNPGEELICLGYPFGAESNTGGFPILRSGRIASYPLLPTESTKALLFDFPIFPGNSGGPVYLSSNNRTYGGRMHTGESAHFIVGLVTQQVKEDSRRRGTPVAYKRDSRQPDQESRYDASRPIAIALRAAEDRPLLHIPAVIVA